MCFFLRIGVFFSSGRGYFLVLSDPGHAGSPPEHHGAGVALAEVHGMCSGGSKSHVTAGRHTEHVKPSRPMQTHVNITKMSVGLCEI